jgi:hypothetical protein
VDVGIFTVRTEAHRDFDHQFDCVISPIERNSSYSIPGQIKASRPTGIATRAVLVLPCLTRSHRRLVDVIVPEADHATEEFERNQAWNAAQLAASGRHEIGNWDANKIGA